MQLRNGRDNCVPYRIDNQPDQQTHLPGKRKDESEPSFPQASVLGRRARADMTEVNTRLNFIFAD